MTPSTRGALLTITALFLLMWAGSALGTWLTGVPG
jgi:hypothetical protein